MAKRKPMWQNTKGRGNTQKRLKKWAHNNLPYVCNHPGCTTNTNLELDHITNLKQGGKNSVDNIQWLCHKHHNIKTQQEASIGRSAWKKRPDKHPGLK
ncbi:HNH endonuclease signature motif containing protein [Corynebacterium pyruviciproducens]